MTRRWHSTERLLRVAAVLALLALAFMVWGVFDPTAIPIVLSMTVGQIIGTASFVTYLIVLWRDVRRTHLLDDSGDEPGATPESDAGDQGGDPDPAPAAVEGES